MPLLLDDKHVTAVEDDHAAVSHPAYAASDIDCVGSCVLKLRPVTVTQEAPDIGALPGSTKELSGASKDSWEPAVPTIAATVTTTPKLHTDSTSDVMHETDDVLLQLAVAHTPPATATVELYNTEPNSSPVTVTDAPPERGVFGGSSAEIAGALNVSTPSLVATMPAAVTTISLAATDST